MAITQVKLDEAFHVIDRAYFLPDQVKNLAKINSPIPIGYGQTCSQPSTVYKMLQWLDPQPGDKVLDVGSGSGWTTALLSYMVGDGGEVFAVELIPELVMYGQNNCAKLNLKNVQFFQAGSVFGLPEHGPYDRILVSAAASQLPYELIGQLKVAGKMVIPIQNSVYIITKTSPDTYTSIQQPGFAFVPLLPG